MERTIDWWPSGRHGWAGKGKAGRTGVARIGQAWQGIARQARKCRFGRDRQGEAWRGMERQGRRDKDWTGGERRRAAWRGIERQEGQGPAGHGAA